MNLFQIFAVLLQLNLITRITNNTNIKFKKKTIFSIKRAHIWKGINLINVPCYIFGSIKKNSLRLVTIECISCERMEHSMRKRWNTSRLEIEFYKVNNC